MAQFTVPITDETFEAEVLKADVPVLVDFWAPWCGPCKMIAPVLEEIAQANIGKLKVAKLNVDENQRYAGQFGVMSIPTMILFHGGAAVGQLVGFRPKADLQRILDQALATLAAK
ncbi:MAG TPA: thioredoxin [Symbiobacteriaceae bacterium]|nr:thioredoxin [Symbiobacteriaceae bacterium]